MRFMSKSGVAAIGNSPSTTDNNICHAFDSVHLNEAGIVHKLCDCEPAGSEAANANNLKASQMPTKKTDGAIIPKAIQVQPKFIRKTPKFPSRERHMAIRRKKPAPSKNLGAECRWVRHVCEKGDEIDDQTE